MKKLQKTLGGGRKSLKSSRKRAFTLAEVLITLAVIGVVAALTIPIVVSSYQKKALYTQFIKTYNAITTVLDLSAADNDGGWTLTGESYAAERESFLDNYIKPYSKTTSMPSCTGVEAPKSLSGDDWDSLTDYCEFIEEFDGSVVAMQDGSIIGISNVSAGGQGLVTQIIFTIDTNGIKGPNMLGRDIFELSYEDDGNLIPRHEYQNSGSTEATSSGHVDANCNPSISASSQGEGCADRLLQEGKMNY